MEVGEASNVAGPVGAGVRRRFTGLFEMTHHPGGLFSGRGDRRKTVALNHKDHEFFDFPF
jgi:hypothetical protein